MSNQATRLRRVPPSRGAVRAALSAREVEREGRQTLRVPPTRWEGWN